MIVSKRDRLYEKSGYSILTFLLKTIQKYKNAIILYKSAFLQSGKICKYEGKNLFPHWEFFAAPRSSKKSL